MLVYKNRYYIIFIKKKYPFEKMNLLLRFSKLPSKDLKHFWGRHIELKTILYDIDPFSHFDTLELSLFQKTQSRATKILYLPWKLRYDVHAFRKPVTISSIFNYFPICSTIEEKHKYDQNNLIQIQHFVWK